MCAELMLAELTVLMCAELNDLPGSDIIEHRLHAKSLIFHVPFSNLASMTKGKVSKRHAAATDDLSNIDPKSELKLFQNQFNISSTFDSNYVQVMFKSVKHQTNIGNKSVPHRSKIDQKSSKSGL